MRGGGGSAWGIVTSITLKAYKTPAGGYTFIPIPSIKGNFCTLGLNSLANTLATLNSTILELSSKFSGVLSVTPAINND